MLKSYYLPLYIIQTPKIKAVMKMFLITVAAVVLGAILANKLAKAIPALA